MPRANALCNYIEKNTVFFWPCLSTILLAMCFLFTSIIPYNICCSNSATCKLCAIIGYRYECWTKYKPASSSELRLDRVGGKSKTEFIIHQSLSSTAAIGKSKGQNLIATESAEEREIRLWSCILQPIVYSWVWGNINHYWTLTVTHAGLSRNAVHFPSIIIITRAL